MTPAPSSLKEQLSLLLQSLHKITQDQNLSNDSGVSFTPPCSFTGGSTASTITPDKFFPTKPTLTAISTDVSSSILQDGESTIVASPSLLKSNEPFFSQKTATQARTSSQAPGDATLDEFAMQEAWRAVARELKPVADVLRTDRLRTALGTSALPRECVHGLSLTLKAPNMPGETADAIIGAQIELLRVMANLCIDHEGNRDILQELSAASAITGMVSHTLAQISTAPSLHVLTLLRTAMGAVLNLQLEHIPTRKALLNAQCLQTLTRVASHPQIYQPNSWALSPSKSALEKVKLGSTISSWAWRIVQEICEDEKEEKEAGRRSASDMSEDEDVESSARSLLSLHSRGDLLRPLLSYAHGSTTSSEVGLDADDVEMLVEADCEILSTASELIEGCAADDSKFRTEAVKPGSAGNDGPIFGKAGDAGFDSPLELLMAFVESATIPPAWKEGSDEGLVMETVKTFSKSKAAVARAVVAIAGEDANMSGLFGESQSSGMGGWFIARLKSWMHYDPKERDDLVSCGMLASGNLARADAHCLALVNEHQLAPFLTSLLGPTNDIKVSHGLVSLLKNLSIPAANKGLIGDLDVIALVTPFLAKEKDMVQPLQFGTVGLLKQLCAGVPSNAAKLVEGETLDALLALIGRVDDVPTKMESTRVLVNVTKALWSVSDYTSVRSKVVRRDAVQALAEMVRTSPKYPILVNEGIFALTLLSSEAEGAELVSQSLLREPAPAAPVEEEQEEAAVSQRRRSSATSASLPPPAAAIDMICSVLARRDARMPPQFASNACMLVLTLCQSAPSSAEVQAAAGRTRSALELLSTQGPDEALKMAAKALHAVTALLS